MSSQHFVLLDATLESQATFFAKDSRFTCWLRSYDKISDALDFIATVTQQNSIEIYVARDNILDAVQLPNNAPRQLIDIFSDSMTINHVTIFTPSINIDVERQIWSLIRDRRLIKKIIPVINLHGYMCTEGTQYFDSEINVAIRNRTTHLTRNLQQSSDDLLKYFNELKENQRRIIENMQEAHSNKPGEQPF